MVGKHPGTAMSHAADPVKDAASLYQELTGGALLQPINNWYTYGRGKCEALGSWSDTETACRFARTNANKQCRDIAHSPENRARATSSCQCRKINDVPRYECFVTYQCTNVGINTGC
ncbi:MAG: hypothetical protein ACPGYL_02695 [Rhodospirillaceae bacterium]